MVLILSEVNLKHYNNDWFKPGNKFKIFIWIIISFLIFRTSLPIPSIIKKMILILFGANIGKGVVIKPSVHIKYPWNLNVGNYTWIGENVWIDNLVKVEIGSNCCISQGAYLLTGNHDYKKNTFDLITAEIKIKDGAWVGAKAIVSPGVTLGIQSLLTVGSIANNDLLDNGIYQGNPAVFKKQRVIK